MSSRAATEDGKSTDPEARRAKYAVPAVEKALDVLELLSDQAVAMTQAQIARALSREPGEIFRLLGVLEARGYLRREANGGYVLTLKLFELSRTHSPHEQLMRAAATPMRELVERVRESCHLCVLHRDQVLVLSQVDSPKPIRLSVEAGSLHSPVETVSGQLLLSRLDPAQREDLLSRRAEYLKMGASARADFLAQLDRVRDQGWAFAENQRYIGGRDLGVPVGSPRASTRVALTIASLKSKDSPDDLFELLPALRQCATDIARMAGLD